MATTDWRGLYTVPEQNYGAQYTGRDDWIHPTNKSLNQYYDHRAYRGGSGSIDAGLTATFAMEEPTLTKAEPQGPTESTRSTPRPMAAVNPGLVADYGVRDASLAINLPASALIKAKQNTRSQPQTMRVVDPKTQDMAPPVQSTRSRPRPMGAVNPGLDADYGASSSLLNLDVPKEAFMNVPAVKKQQLSAEPLEAIRKAGDVFEDYRGIAENIQTRRR